MTTRTSIVTAALLTTLALPALATPAPIMQVITIDRGALVVEPGVDAATASATADFLERAGLAGDEPLLLRLAVADDVPTLTIEATSSFLADAVAVAHMQWLGAHLSAEVFEGAPLQVILTTADQHVILRPTEDLGVPRTVTSRLTLYVGPGISEIEAEGVATDMYPVFDAPDAPTADWMLFRDGEAICLASFGAMPSTPAARMALIEGVSEWLTASFPGRPICLESRARDLSVRGRIELLPGT